MAIKSTNLWPLWLGSIGKCIASCGFVTVTLQHDIISPYSEAWYPPYQIPCSMILSSNITILSNILQHLIICSVILFYHILQYQMIYYHHPTAKYHYILQYPRIIFCLHYIQYLEWENNQLPDWMQWPGNKNRLKLLKQKMTFANNPANVSKWSR